MRSVGLSQKGTRSEFNEDAFRCDPSRSLFVVADGVGSGPDGHQASRAVVDAFPESLSVSIDVIRDTLVQVNVEINQAAALKARGGMASTVVCAWIDGMTAHLFHAGDSRIYRFSQGSLERVTVDHEREVVREGVSKMMVTRALGAKPSIEIELSSVMLQSGDSLVLMSDGISDPLSDDTIARVASDDSLSLYDRCRRLVSMAIDANGQDDKTIIWVTV